MAIALTANGRYLGKRNRYVVGAPGEPRRTQHFPWVNVLLLRC